MARVYAFWAGWAGCALVWCIGDGNTVLAALNAAMIPLNLWWASRASRGK